MLAGFKVENLVDDEILVSATIQATRIAIGTHHREKREMLRNALLKVAVGRGPQEDLQESFLAAVEAFTCWHVRLLRFIWTGLADLNRAGIWNVLKPYAIGDYAAAVGALYPEMKGQDNFLLYLMTDLKNRGFSTVSRPSDGFPQSPGVTNIGIDFLGFIASPPT